MAMQDERNLQRFFLPGRKHITSAKSCKQVSTILERAIKEMDEVKKGDMTVTFRLIGSFAGYAGCELDDRQLSA